VSRRSTAQILALVLIAVGLLVATLVPLPYVVLSPGPAVNVLGTLGGKQVITVSGATTYPTNGRLDLTTVSESGGPYGRVALTSVVGGWLDPTVAVVPTRVLYPSDVTAQQVEQENTADMLQSQDDAVVAALRHLGLPVTLTVSVRSVEAGGPSDGHLKAGDRILSVDGTAVSTAAELRTQIGKHKPGDTITFVVERGGQKLTVPVVAGQATDDPNRAMVGFVPTEGYLSPVTVTVTVEDVGGPSAGLMLSLGIIDKLTPEQENGGAHVAGTGTIDVNGTVGPIGGIRQKLAGARSVGATVFLVPAANCAEALLHVPAGLRLVKVTDVDDALSGMAAAVAGRSAPTCAAA
jgi:PDZ domain-containing protein